MSPRTCRDPLKPLRRFSRRFPAFVIESKQGSEEPPDLTLSTAPVPSLSRESSANTEALQRVALGAPEPAA